MSPKPRLARGGRQLVDQLLADLADARSELDAARTWNKKREPYDVERKLGDAQRALDLVERRIREELEPMLQRREEQRERDDLLAELERRIAALEATSPAGAQPAPDIRRVK